MAAADPPVSDRALWTVRRDDRQATAALRLASFGRELRVCINGDLVFRRLLDDTEADDAAAAHLLRIFDRQGWVRVPD